jgi:hypothetical protein
MRLGSVRLLGRETADSLMPLDKAKIATEAIPPRCTTGKNRGLDLSLERYSCSDQWCHQQNTQDAMSEG